MTTWGSACSIRFLFTPIRWQIKPFLCIRGVAWERFVRVWPWCRAGGWAFMAGETRASPAEVESLQRRSSCGMSTWEGDMRLLGHSPGY